jgi:PIN domain nuclease of toxin-antitoxin system
MRYFKFSISLLVISLFMAALHVAHGRLKKWQFVTKLFKKPIRPCNACVIRLKPFFAAQRYNFSFLHREQGKTFNLPPRIHWRYTICGVT